MRKTLLFDLDGTLLNTLKDLQISTNFALNTYNYAEKSLEEIRNSVGNGLRMLIRRSLPANAEDATVDAVLQTMKEYYRLHCHDETKPYPGVPELLARLRAEGCRMAIVSNKADAMVQELQRVFFPDTITVSIGESNGIRRKPAPDMVFAALRLLGSDGSDAAYIGDSQVDIETAKNAGLPCLSVAWGFRTPRDLFTAGAERVCLTTSELYDAIKGS